MEQDRQEKVPGAVKVKVAAEPEQDAAKPVVVKDGGAADKEAAAAQAEVGAQAPEEGADRTANK